MKNSTLEDFEELSPVLVIVRDRHQITLPHYWRRTLNLDQLERLDPGSVVELVVRVKSNGGSRGKQSKLEDGIADGKRRTRKPPDRS